MPGITDLGAEAANETAQNDSDDSGYESDYERFDLSGSSFGRQHPTTAVRGTAVALRKLWDENDPDRSDVAAVMDDPTVVTSDDALENTVVVQSDDEGDDFKVVNTDDDDTKVLEDMGIDFSGNTYYGEVLDDFEGIDRIALKRGGGAGRSIASVLDVNGATGARTVEDEDGDPVLHDGGFPEHNGGLVEYHPDGREGERPRYARDTQLRPDVEGNDIVVMVQRLADIQADYDGHAYWGTVFAELDEDRRNELAEQYAENNEEKDPEDFITELDGDTFVQLRPTDEFEPDDDLLRETGYISWQRPDIDELNEAREAEGFDPYEPDN